MEPFFSPCSITVRHRPPHAIRLSWGERSARRWCITCLPSSGEEEEELNAKMRVDDGVAGSSGSKISTLFIKMKFVKLAKQVWSDVSTLPGVETSHCVEHEVGAPGSWIQQEAFSASRDHCWMKTLTEAAAPETTPEQCLLGDKD